MEIEIKNPNFDGFENCEEDQETIKVPGKYVVCWRCSGKGTHVNPAVDGNGLSQEDFDEDPDFYESYMSGVYDVPCHECKGKRVLPEVDRDTLKYTDPQLLKDIDEYEREEADYQALCAAERRAGC